MATPKRSDLVKSGLHLCEINRHEEINRYSTLGCVGNPFRDRTSSSCVSDVMRTSEETGTHSIYLRNQTAGKDKNLTRLWVFVYIALVALDSCIRW